MNALTTQTALAACYSMPEGELLETMGASLYPGAKPASIKLVLSYCKAGQLDPMQKPVHLVPMSVKTGEKNGYGDDVYENRDVVMPGIALYRTQAARTGIYAGMDEPEFGPKKMLAYKRKHVDWVSQGEGKKNKLVTTYRDAELEYPEWCKVVVYRMVGGVRCAFAAIEFWIENYATAGKKTDAPNAMWEKRPRGQIVKCAEAQALRKGFPEVGNQPTAEEMAGKSFDFDDSDATTIDATTGEIVPKDAATTVAMPQSKSKPAKVADASDAVDTKAAAKPATAVVAGSDDAATPGEKAYITKGIERMGLDLAGTLAECKVASLDTLTKAGFAVVRDHLRSVTA